MSNKYCAYVAGDKNIIYPSILLFLSMKRFHDSQIDFYIFSDTSFANDEQLNICKLNNITLIDLKDLKSEDYIDQFRSFDRYPKEIFYNYFAPIYLRQNYSYDYAIKFDHDMLCVNPINLEEIIPSSSEIFTAFKTNKITDCLSISDVSLLQKSKNWKIKYSEQTVNAGLIVIDLKEFEKHNIHHLYSDIYTTIDNLSITFETKEQLAFGLIQSVLNCEFKDLSEKYNYRPGESTDCFNNDISIIHYTSAIKPWKSFNVVDAVRNVDIYDFSIISHLLLCNTWIEFSNSLDLKKFERNKCLYNKDTILKTDKFLRTQYKLSYQNRNYLSNHIEYLNRHFDLQNNYFIDKYGLFIQIFLFDVKDIFYEIRLVNDNVRISLNLKNDYQKFNDVLKNIEIPNTCTSLEFKNDYINGEVFLELSKRKDYQDNVHTLIVLILCSKKVLLDSIKGLNLRIKNLNI